MTGNQTIRSYYRVIRDSAKTIAPSTFKKQLLDTSDIVGKSKIAPRTKKDMAHQFYENLDNYFIWPGRKVPARPLQKLFDRRFDTRKYAKGKVSPEDVENSANTVLEPLNDDLRTPTTKNISGLVIDVAPVEFKFFPVRNLGAVRKSYTKKTPKRSPQKSLPISTFAVKIDHSSTNCIDDGSFQMQPHESVLTYSPQVMAPYARRTRSQSPNKTMPSSSSSVRQVVISGEQIPMEFELRHIPQYSNEISVEDSEVIISEANTVNTNVLDLSDLIQTNNDTQIDEKMEIASSDLVLCTSIEEMNEVIVMGENGERYRFVALNDGQLSLVAESSVQ